MPQIPQPMAGALQLLFGMPLQTVDFHHQRVQLQRHVFIERIALATAKLFDLLAGLPQR